MAPPGLAYRPQLSKSEDAGLARLLIDELLAKAGSDLQPIHAPILEVNFRLGNYFIVRRQRSQIWISLLALDLCPFSPSVADVGCSFTRCASPLRSFNNPPLTLPLLTH